MRVLDCGPSVRVLSCVLAGALVLSACGGGRNGTSVEQVVDPTPGEATGDLGDFTADIEFAGFLPPGSPWRDAYEWMMAEVEDRTQGQVTFTVHDQGSLLPQEEIMPGIRDNVIDAGFFTDSFHPSDLPLTSVAAIPFLATNGQAQSAVFTELYEEYPPFREEFERQNLHVVYFAPTAPNILAATQPVEGVQDLSGLRVRALGAFADAVEGAGGIPSPIPLADLYSSLERGVLDGTFTGFELIADLSLHEVASHIVDPAIGLFAIAMVGMNLDVWDSLPAAAQRIIEEVAAESIDRTLDGFASAGEEVCDRLEDNDISLVRWAEDETEAWREQVFGDLLASWTERVSSDQRDASAFIDRYVELVEEHEAEADVLASVVACHERR